MYGTLKKLGSRGTLCAALCALLLIGCGKSDNPLTITGNQPSNGGGDSGPVDPGTVTGCTIQFKSLVQLKISANPAGDPLEVLDANPVDVAPIPIQVDGGKLTLRGESFPEIILTRLSEQADLRIKGAPGTVATGTYNADTGEFKIDDFKFTLEILTKGTTDPFLPGEALLPNIDFTTGSITASGNLNAISETGAPLSKDSRNLSLVIGMTLPTNFSPLSVLDSMIGGGALIAKFDGVLDLLPEECGSGTPGEFPGDGVAQPPGLKVSIEDQAGIGNIDFGTSAVVLKNVDGQQEIDCLEAGNRQIVSRTVTISNVGGEAKTVKFGQPQDTDNDRKTPLCGGSSEFVRGTITMKNGTTCKTVKVGGKDFPIGECTLPAGSSASVSFPLMYLPFNFTGADEGTTSPHDTGSFAFDFGGAAPFAIGLKGGTVPDFRDVFFLSKVTGGVDSTKQIRNKGTLKVQLDSAAAFTQAMVLKNQGGSDWESISFTLEKGSVFKIDPPVINRLPAADGTNLGRTDFKVIFNPGAESINTDTLTIKMTQVGSVTPESPQGIESKIVVNLLGTVGLPRLSGEISLQFDYLAALIDHNALDSPTESIDYRDFPELAQAPMKLVFTDTDNEDVKKVQLTAPVTDIYDPNLSVADRQRVLRIFTSRASIGKNGERLQIHDSSDKCYEPASLLVPYKPGDCSYFYHNLVSSDEGIYDDDTGDLTIPNIQLQMANPYHADIIGKWPASNPTATPDYIFDVLLNMTFTTHILDRKFLEEDGTTFDLLPDSRISPADLVVKSKPLGDECPEGNVFDGTDPNFRCFLSTGERFLQGHAVTLKPDQSNQYDVVLVGVAQFPSALGDPELPWFCNENGGSRIFITILGRLFKEP